MAGETRGDIGTRGGRSGKGPVPLAVAVDIVVFTVEKDALKVLLIRRGIEPFKGSWCLPGGFVRESESLEDAAFRELAEETGVGKDGVYLEQLYTWGAPARDPRGRTISVSYFALVPFEKMKPFVTGMEKITDVSWHPLGNLPGNGAELGFDHGTIISYALKRLRYKLEYTAVGLGLLPDEFTLPQLQRLYETILGEKLDKRNFRKKIASLDLLAPTGKMHKGGFRPASLYRFKGREGAAEAGDREADEVGVAREGGTFRKVRFEG